jgi:hypothetical protein
MDSNDEYDKEFCLLAFGINYLIQKSKADMKEYQSILN